MSLRRGSKVWAEDRNLAWVAAEVAEFVGKQAQVITSSGKKVNFSPDFFFLLAVLPTLKLDVSL